MKSRRWHDVGEGVANDSFLQERLSKGIGLSQRVDLVMRRTTKSVIADVRPAGAAYGRPRTRTSSFWS